ncbi:MAG: sensor histidine kinase [Bacteroidota bacterium]
MKHPLLSNIRFLAFYGVFWLILASANALVLWNYYDLALHLSFINTFVQYGFFAVLGLSIWYVVKYNSPETYKWWSLLLFHLIAATAIIIVWTYLAAITIKLFAPELADYMQMSLPSRMLTGYLLYVFYVLLFMAIIYYQNFREKVKRESELKSLIKEAELHALKSQINPHFLFNSLNSISSLTMSDPAKAQEMVINLSSLMRYSLKHNQNEKVTFGTELQNNKLYLAIEKVRFGSKLLPVFHVDEKCYNASLPNMILQPIYENAIKYGVYEATEPVEIITHGSCDGKYLEISVGNTYDPDVINRKGEGIGLRNIRERLQIIYGGSAIVKVTDDKNFFTITLRIPQL